MDEDRTNQTIGRKPLSFVALLSQILFETSSKNWINAALGVAAAILSAGAAVIVILLPATKSQVTAVDALSPADIAAIERRLEDLKGQLDARAASPATSPSLAELEARMVRIEAAQARINTAILASPEKALEVPLLKRDIEDTKSRNAENVAALRGEIERVYTLAQWLIGGLSLGVLALAAQSILRRGGPS